MAANCKAPVITDVIQIQNELLKMLAKFVSICEKNNIIYFLAGGSLLGAVRHGGFIPWDDDIDVLLPRDSYEKLLTVWQLQESQYELVSINTTAGYEYPYAKLLNKDVIVKEKLLATQSFLWIDIFPLDGLPNNFILRNFHFGIINILKYLRWQSDVNRHEYDQVWKSYVKKIFFFPFFILGSNKISAIIDQFAKKYKIKESKKVACVVGKYNKKECVDKCVFSSVKHMQFENQKVSVPHGYDTYLHNLYGDYMKLPARSDRQKHL